MSEFVLARNGVEGLCFLAMRCGIQGEGLSLRSLFSSEVRFTRASRLQSNRWRAGLNQRVQAAAATKLTV
jgi:hypothetical protein